jgi:hypothetical protein
MNTDTGQIYRTNDEIIDARARGESITMVSDNVAAMVERGAIEMDKDAKRAAWRERWFGRK